MKPSTSVATPVHPRARSIVHGLGRAVALAMAIGACSSSSNDTAAADASPADTATPEVDGGTADAGFHYVAAAFFRGTLAASVAASEASSNMFFMGVEAQANAAGDDGHQALLGTTDLGTSLNQFVGLDTWSSTTSMDAVYAAAPVQAFGASFYATPPEFVTFLLTDFYQWGDTHSGNAYTPHYFVMTRGRFNAALDATQAVADPIAQGAEAQYKAAGNVAHIVWSGREDPQEALIVDIWSSETNIDSFYTNAAFSSSVRSLFDSTGPNYGVYGSTDWVTW